jgi:hypothetical protein
MLTVTQEIDLRTFLGSFGYSFPLEKRELQAIHHHLFVDPIALPFAGKVLHETIFYLHQLVETKRFESIQQLICYFEDQKREMAGKVVKLILLDLA